MALSVYVSIIPLCIHYLARNLTCAVDPENFSDDRGSCERWKSLDGAGPANYRALRALRDRPPPRVLLSAHQRNRSGRPKLLTCSSFWRLLS